MKFTREQKLEFVSVIKETFNEIILGNDQFLDNLAEKIADKIAIKSLQRRVDCLEKQISEMNETLNSRQQLTLINNIRIIGIAEDGEPEDLEEKVVTLVNNKLNVELKPDDIECCYRIGKRGDAANKNRSVLLKLTTRRKKVSIMKKRKDLKKTGIVMYDDLTSSNFELYNTCISRYGRKNVWTDSSKIFIRDRDNVKRVIRKLEDLVEN